MTPEDKDETLKQEAEKRKGSKGKEKPAEVIEKKPKKEPKEEPEEKPPEKSGKKPERKSGPEKEAKSGKKPKEEKPAEEKQEDTKKVKPEKGEKPEEAKPEEKPKEESERKKKPEGAMEEKPEAKKLEQEDKKPEDRKRFEEERFDKELWKPRTKLGEMVRKGEITSMSDVLHSGLPIKEVEIIDCLLPDMQEEILSVGRIQRVTDSGRRMRFRVVTVVGNGNGYVGIGHSKGKEAGPTIRKAIERAKLNIVEIKRGCGSWGCGCGDPHTIPFKVTGNSGSVSIGLIPAPKGIGLVSGEIPKKILHLAGISDIWVRTEGHTRTSFNFAYATFDALMNTNYIKVRDKDIEKLSIVSGPVE